MEVGEGGGQKNFPFIFIPVGVKKGYIQRNSLLGSLEVHFFGEVVILVIVIVIVTVGNKVNSLSSGLG